jgi:DNA-binding HxlR family transcriptional regulator
LIEKYDFETMPLHTEYELTEKGNSLMPILKDLNQWGKEWLQ